MTSHVLQPGDRYNLAYRGELGLGYVVGFSIRAGALDTPASTGLHIHISLADTKDVALPGFGSLSEY